MLIHFSFPSTEHCLVFPQYGTLITSPIFSFHLEHLTLVPFSFFTEHDPIQSRSTQLLVHFSPSSTEHNYCSIFLLLGTLAYSSIFLHKHFTRNVSPIYFPLRHNTHRFFSIFLFQHEALYINLKFALSTQNIYHFFTFSPLSTKGSTTVSHLLSLFILGSPRDASLRKRKEVLVNNCFWWLNSSSQVYLTEWNRCYETGEGKPRQR